MPELTAGQGHAAEQLRNHWVTMVNARLSRPILLEHGRSFDLIADIFNLPNLFPRLG
jgi:hypothetical protein